MKKIIIGAIIGFVAIILGVVLFFVIIKKGNNSNRQENRIEQQGEEDNKNKRKNNKVGKVEEKRKIEEVGKMDEDEMDRMEKRRIARREQEFKKERKIEDNKEQTLKEYIEENNLFKNIKYSCFEMVNMTRGNAKVLINRNIKGIGKGNLEYVDLTYDYNPEGKIWNVKVVKQYKEELNPEDDEYLYEGQEEELEEIKESEE